MSETHPDQNPTDDPPPIEQQREELAETVDDGETRKIRSRSWASVTSIHRSASSGVRSGVMMPHPPAAARSRAKASAP